GQLAQLLQAGRGGGVGAGHVVSWEAERASYAPWRVREGHAVAGLPRLCDGVHGSGTSEAVPIRTRTWLIGKKSLPGGQLRSLTGLPLHWPFVLSSPALREPPPTCRIACAAPRCLPPSDRQPTRRACWRRCSARASTWSASTSPTAIPPARPSAPPRSASPRRRLAPRSASWPTCRGRRSASSALPRARST